MSDAPDSSLNSISDALRAREISPVELTRLSLERIAADVIGRPFQEGRILRIARAYERTTDWTTGSPR